MTQTADTNTLPTEMPAMEPVGRYPLLKLDALASEMRRQVSDSVDRYLDLGNRWHALQLGITSGKVICLSNYRRAK